MKAILITFLSILFLSASGQTEVLKGRIEPYNPDSKPFLLDTIPVVEHVEADDDENLPAYFIDGKHSDPSLLKTLNPALIDSIYIDKNIVEISGKCYIGQIHLFMKEAYDPQLISLTNLKNKYLKQSSRPTIFMIDDEIIKDDCSKYLVDQKYLLKIVADSLTDARRGLNVDIVKLITKTEENIKKANEIFVRGEAEAKRIETGW